MRLENGTIRGIHGPHIGERTHKDRAQEERLNKNTLFKQVRRNIHADVMIKDEQKHLVR